jgi:DNA-binding CsgD family transcriptional regulator
VPFVEPDEDGIDGMGCWEADVQFEQTSARDILHILSTGLKRAECSVLHCLADGLSMTEIGRRLGLSLPTVTKYRRKIARLATKFGVLPLRVQREVSHTPTRTEVRRYVCHIKVAHPESHVTPWHLESDLLDAAV